MKELRIRKLTPKEYWRLQGFTDEDFKKAAFKKDIIYLEGEESKCCANLKVVTEKQKHTDLDTYVLCTINDLSDMGTLKIIKRLLVETPENEKMQNVNFAITKLEDMEHLGYVTNIIKCFTFMEMQCTLTEDKDRQVTVIIVQVGKDNRNIEKCMKITTELNLTQIKLYTILILFAQIMRLKIYGYSTLKANIQSVIAITESYENSILLKISNLKMENISLRISSSQLYKQAGNSICVPVVQGILKNLLKIDKEEN